MPRGKKDQDLRDRVLHLRIEERLSLQEIQLQTGASKGSLSAWLQGFPLTKEEQRSKYQARKKGGPPKKNRGLESNYHLQFPPEGFTRLQKGKIAEAAVLFRLFLRGFSVYGSSFDGDKLDWIAQLPGGPLWKIQVKWTLSPQFGLATVPNRCGLGAHGFRPYSSGELDFLVGYHYFTDTCYVWSWDEIRGQGSVTISPEAEEAWEKLLPT